MVIKYFSAFSGVGTDSFAIKRHNLNWECVGWSEKDKYAQITHNENHPELADKLYSDFTKIDYNSLPNFDVFFGGFPCQSFSIAGLRRGFEDTRGTMFFYIADMLRVKQPRFVLLENVEGLMSHDKGNTYKVIEDTLVQLGYTVTNKVLNTRDFGIPQNRKRVWIIASKNTNDILNFNYPIVQDSCLDMVNDILEPCVDVKYKLSDRAIVRMKPTVDKISPCITANYFKEGRNCPKVYIIDSGASTKYQNAMEDCSPTLKATRSDYAIVPYYRRFTPEECFRLQGFKPFEVKSSCSDTQKYKQAGNGWSINVAELLITEIDRVLKIVNQFNIQGNFGYTIRTS